MPRRWWTRVFDEYEANPALNASNLEEQRESKTRGRNETAKRKYKTRDQNENPRRKYETKNQNKKPIRRYKTKNQNKKPERRYKTKNQNEDTKPKTRTKIRNEKERPNTEITQEGKASQSTIIHTTKNRKREKRRMSLYWWSSDSVYKQVMGAAELSLCCCLRFVLCMIVFEMAWSMRACFSYSSVGRACGC